MAEVSPYFNHYNSENEQNLIQGMVDEAIYQRGLEVTYIPRTQENIDYLYGEDPSQSFDSFKKIAMYPANVDGFDGSEIMSMFGNDEFGKKATFIVSKRRWEQLFPEYARPREGDVIFMPIVKEVLEIKFVENESPFFEKGKQYVYELTVESFEYSYEDMNTGDAEVDGVLTDNLLIGDPSSESEGYADNQEIEDDADTFKTFDPNNPFGVN